MTENKKQFINGSVEDNGRKIYTVSELNREIKIILEDAYPDIWLEGEISNFKTYSSGHMYFSLKDENSQINSVIFQNNARNIKFKIEDGLKVIVKGKISTYQKRGEYQILINYIEPSGKGALQLAFEQLKSRLQKEGLFDQKRKKPIPILPQKIGIVTSPIGAAIRDILSIINRRFANVEILLYPVRVQGDEAKYEIAEAIDYLNNNYPALDVLLVGRGGGSLEDLWAFNEEIVARAIFTSKIPIISCVGHEIDYTISDFVADLRAPTPSAAAELVVKNKTELSEKIKNLYQMINNQIQFLLKHYQEKLKNLSESRALTSPGDIIDEQLQEMDDIYGRLTRAMDYRFEIFSRDSKQLTEKLNLLSPLNILGRGYSICWKIPENTILKQTEQLKTDDNVKIKLYKGEFTAKVEKI